MGNISQLSWLETAQTDRLSQSASYFETILQALYVKDYQAGWPDVFGQKLRAYVRGILDTPIQTLSLFSGGGGLDIAFHDVGFASVNMVELDGRYVETLRRNAQEGQRFAGTEPLCVDIRSFHPPENMHVDFIIGGPPCQTFSAAGRRAAGVAGLDDPRGTLFHEYVRILRILQPRGFLFENVYGIIGAQDGKAWKEIVNAFTSVGYTISHRILDAADYGVPQHRERLIIVGTRDDTFLFPRPTHGPDSSDQRSHYTAGCAVQGINDEKPKVVGGRYGHLLKDIPPGLNYSFYTEEMGHPFPYFAWRSKFSDLLYKADSQRPIRTLKAQGGQYTGPFHWENRPFSIGELKRLQTIPDDYALVGGQMVAVEQIGNSVPPQFGRMLALAVLEQIFHVSFPFKIETLDVHEELSFRRRKTALTALYRQKAKDAIVHLYPTGSRENEKKEEGRESVQYHGYLGPKFSWHVQADQRQLYPWNIAFSVRKTEQAINILVAEEERVETDYALVIEVMPVLQWKMQEHIVRLHLQSLSPHLFTACWKAFEYYIAQEGYKADLVQLNGYYQYEPAFKVRALKEDTITVQHETSAYWNIVELVLQGVGVRRILTLEQLATLWEYSLPETKKALLFLRSLGYEVRSEYTNAQIMRDHVLIPYVFPTLNEKSVQLRKTLFPKDDIEGE